MAARAAYGVRRLYYVVLFQLLLLMGITLHHAAEAAMILAVHARTGLVDGIARTKRHLRRPVAVFTVNLTLYVFYGSKCYIFLQIVTFAAPEIMEYH